jgi:hypothetical protein
LNGTTSVSELELDCSIVLNNIGNNIVELIETFELDGVGTIVYDDEIEINYNSYQYVELPIDVINEILDILEKYADYMELTNKAY